MSQFSFEYPLFLLAIILFAVCDKWCRQRSRAIFFPHVKRLIAQNASSGTLLEWLKWIGIVSAVVAFASPVLTKNYTSSKKEGRDIVLILDASDSMRQGGFDANDPWKNKFNVAKEVIGSFADKRTSDRIGMITFADIAFISSPLTFEKDFLQNIIQMQQLGMAGRRTAINDALVQAYGMLSQSKAKSKIAILLTDGIENMSKVSFDELLKMIKEQNIKLYTIGMGNAGEYDAHYLKALADTGGGQAYGANDAAALLKIYEAIDKLEVTEMEDRKIAEHTYLYVYPLFLAIMSLLLFVYFRSSKGA
ncbi:MAG: VWA domain-containing protein [Sulfurovum sp.]|nr:VWA domain-containing protein [Sulfurovum sp.]MDD3601725.1 VWA domain-containing protein [Sulfurovum sp.]